MWDADMCQFCSVSEAMLRMLFLILSQQEVIKGCWAGNKSNKLAFEITDAIFLLKQTLIRVFVSWELIRDMINNLHKLEWELLGLKNEVFSYIWKEAGTFGGGEHCLQTFRAMLPQMAQVSDTFFYNYRHYFSSSWCLLHVKSKSDESTTKYMDHILSQVSQKQTLGRCCFPWIVYSGLWEVNI